MNATLKDKVTIFDLQKWNVTLPENTRKYRQVQPYPHIVLDSFLEEWTAEKALSEFPAVKDVGWIHYVHVNEKKHGLNKADVLPSLIRTLFQGLNPAVFLQYISKLTGILNILPGNTLRNGGLYQSEWAGFSNVQVNGIVQLHLRNWRCSTNYQAIRWCAEELLKYKANCRLRLIKRLPV